ncbi:MAG: hypothetical protein QOG04_2000 [Actinomycetota bacterium]|jgi:hypothetical protein|nr:hypothetical protein [Actinomycetota bacterium]
MTSLLKKPIAKKVMAAVAVKEIVDRIQEARAPRKSFLRRHWGKLALLAVAGGGYVAWQRSQQAAADSLSGFGQSSVQPTRRDPSMEPDERLDTQIRVPDSATEPSNTPSPAGR